jgi:hypothetical protein
MASDEDSREVLVEWLVWARCPLVPLPPFATKFGPSVLFFYHNRSTNGGVTYMAEGFKWNIDSAGEVETTTERIARLYGALVAFFGGKG